MTIKTTIIFVAIVNFVLLTVTGHSLYSSYEHIEEATHIREQQETSIALVDELRTAAQDLTNFARNFASTGEKQTQISYQNVVDIRDGKKPRPDTYEIAGQETIPLLDLFKKADFTSDEMDLLQVAFKTMDTLLLFDAEGMNGAKGLFMDDDGGYTIEADPDLLFATRLLNGFRYNTSVANLMEHLAALQKKINQRLDEKIRYADREVRKSEITLVVSFGLTTLVIILFNLLVYVGVLKPLLLCNTYAIDISRGNLESSLTFQSKNELGSLANSLRRMVTNLKFKIVESDQKKLEAEKAKTEAEKAKSTAEKALEQAKVSETEAAQAKRNAENAKDQAEVAKNQAVIAQKNAETAKQEGMLAAARQLESIASVIASASSELMQQIHTSEQGSLEQQTLLAETAKAMQEMNLVVLDVSKNVANTAKASTHTRHNATEGANIVKEVVASIEKVQQESLLLKKNMTHLEQQTEAISQIMSLISNIADQTNLLALNASIEAARAGQAGLSFAVVADEVRKLAEKTMNSTVDVGEAVRAMQESARNSVLQVDMTVQTIAKATALAEKSGVALTAIVQEVDTTADQIRAIAAACEEQSATTGHINNSVMHVNKISTKTSETMQESAQSVSNLSQQAQTLTALIQEMKQG